jgi:hypothetical protein
MDPTRSERHERVSVFSFDRPSFAAWLKATHSATTALARFKRLDHAVIACLTDADTARALEGPPGLTIDVRCADESRQVIEVELHDDQRGGPADGGSPCRLATQPLRASAVVTCAGDELDAACAVVKALLARANALVAGVLASQGANDGD